MVYQENATVFPLAIVAGVSLCTRDIVFGFPIEAWCYRGSLDSCSIGAMEGIDWWWSIDRCYGCGPSGDKEI
jgi:hypothetical protein